MVRKVLFDLYLNQVGLLENFGSVIDEYGAGSSENFAK